LEKQLVRRQLPVINVPVQPKIMGKALGIVYRTIATHLTHKAGYKNSTAHTGAVTLIQRFGSALNLNIHFHMLFLDGVYEGKASSSARFRRVKVRPTALPGSQTLPGSDPRNPL